MRAKLPLIFVRLLPVILLVLAAAAWFNDVQDGGQYVLRNLVPPLTVVVLAALALGIHSPTPLRI